MVVISGIKFNWQPVTSGMPLGSILGPTQFNVFINDLDNAIECSVACEQLIGNWELEGRASIQKDLDRLEERATRNLRNSMRVKANASTFPWSNPMQQHKVGADLPILISINYAILL